MKLLLNIKVFLLLLFIYITSTSCNPDDNPSGETDFTLPPGFKIEVYAENVDGARSMAISKNGILFVGTKEVGGNVYAVIDSDNEDHQHLG